MNAAGTMARVYHSLKARVMAGDFAPGERIDPAPLSLELSASATPIRDALHRLAGERLVENWQHEGFRCPIVTEAGLRDLYHWHDEVVRATLRATERASAPVAQFAPPADRAALVPALFDWLATLSPNREHRTALAGLNDRCHALRLAEAALFEAPDVAGCAAAVSERRFSDARRWFADFYAVRVRRLPELAAAFRPREL